MAEIETGGGKKGPKKASTKVDMTPMVDLAFLLITFFMLTTTFSKPQVMEVAMPADGDPMPLNEKRAFTVLIGENSKVYWFQGTLDPAVHQTDFTDQGLRKLLLEKKREIKQNTGKDMYVVIKATDNASYNSLVNTLDEMDITSAPTYAIADLNDGDRKLMALHNIR